MTSISCTYRIERIVRMVSYPHGARQVMLTAYDTDDRVLFVKYGEDAERTFIKLRQMKHIKAVERRAE